MSNCKGVNCGAVNGKGHSDECVREHENTYGVPDCFNRAESNGRLFDNCMFYNDCKQVRPVCVNNPATLK